MKTALRKIANILYINIQNINSYSLLNGKLGVLIFFYHYFRYSKIEAYNKFADYLLDETIENLERMNLSDLIDFKWSIEYLIQNKFVEGDPEEVLEDINIRITSLSKETQDMDNNRFLFFENCKQKKVDLEIVNSFLDKTVLEPYVENLTVEKGITGLALSLISNNTDE
jgi:hypothetical protein